jgi:hypothetical protein
MRYACDFILHSLGSSASAMRKWLKLRMDRIGALGGWLGIEPTHRGFADPFSSQLALSTSTPDPKLEPFCPLFVRFRHVGRGT